jgi:tRNA 2-thiouridine synthesizing protein A
MPLKGLRIKADRSIDVRGETCPYPVLKAGAALRQMSPGEVLEVLVDYEVSVETGLPSFCEKHNCAYQVEEDQGFWRFYIEKSEEF